MEKIKNIPTHDPQTGEVNPYYEQLTGERNPLNSIYNPELYAEIMNKNTKYDNKIKKYTHLEHMPNQKWHKYISFIKSGVRIIGYGFIPFNLVVACLILILSEVIGIVEEMV